MKLNYNEFLKYLRYARRCTQESMFILVFDAIRSVFLYNISLLEYFQFKFYEKDSLERGEYAGTGYMFEFQRIMNPRNARNDLRDKIKFLENNRRFINRWFFTFSDLELNRDECDTHLENEKGLIVLKSSTGQGGREVRIVSTENLSNRGLYDMMKKEGYDLLEEYVTQHPALMELSASGLNTVRVITQIDGINVTVIDARLRISVCSNVDNMAAGNIAASIDVETGKVVSAAVYSDITKASVDYHPITNRRIIDFKIPYWGDVLVLCKELALYNRENRSVGWDIAITSKGPEVIEGNHNWCKLLWQLPEGRGLKYKIDPYLAQAEVDRRIDLSKSLY